MGGHNKAKAAKLISTMAIKLRLNGDIKTTAAIVNRANELFKNSDIKKVRGINQYMDKTKISDAKAAACLYIACRQEGLPMTFNDIVAVSTLSGKEICRSFVFVLNSDEAYWFCEVLSLSKEVEEAATSITMKTRNLGIVSEGITNVVVALAAIYMASQATDDKRTKKEISNITGFPPDFRFVTPIENLPKT